MLRLGFEKVCMEVAKVVPRLEDAGEPVTLSEVLGALLQDRFQLFVSLKSSLVVECQAERGYISIIGREGEQYSLNTEHIINHDIIIDKRISVLHLVQNKIIKDECSSQTQTSQRELLRITSGGLRGPMPMARGQLNQD